MCFCWGTLLTVLSAAMLGVYALNQVNRQLKHHVLREFEKKFPDLEIDFASVQLDEQKGISIRRLECSIPGGPGLPSRRLLMVDELYLECPVTFHALYRREVRINKILVRSPCFRLSRSVNGRFEELSRLQSQSESPLLVPIEILDGTLLYEDLALGEPSPLKIDEIQFSLSPPEQNKRITILSDLAPDSPPSDAWKVAGRAKSDAIRQLNFKGYYIPVSEAESDVPRPASWEIKADCRHLDWSAELLKYLRPIQSIAGKPDYRKAVESFKGSFDLNVQARSDPGEPNGFRFDLDGSLFQGRFELGMLDRTVSDVSARFRITPESLVVEKLTGMAEAARFTLNYSQDGLRKPENALLSANVRNLAFDGRTVEALSPFLNEQTRKLLARFEYAGTTDLETRMQLAKGRWKPERLVLGLSDLSFSFLEFPYQVERLQGEMRVDSSAKLDFELSGRRDDPLRTKIVGVYDNVFVDPVGQVEIWGQDVPIDAKLMGTIPPSQRRVIETLHPAGKINAYLLLTLPPNDLPLEKHFKIGLNDVSVEYDKFPYPLRKIGGWLSLDDDVWEFRNLVGTNESASVVGSGHLKPIDIPNPADPARPIRTTELLLTLHAEELPVDGQLTEAILDANQRELLTGLRARGKIGLDALIRYYSHDHRLNLEFRAIPCSEFSLRPDRFPFRIDNLAGEIHYDNGMIHSKRLTGNNRNTKLTTGVLCRFEAGGRWMFRLNPLTIEQLNLNGELLEALPSDLRRIAENLQIIKPVNLNGGLEFFKENLVSPLRTVWDSIVVLHQNDAEIGFPVRNIFGEVRLTGFSEDNEFRLAGDLNLDSAMVRGFQATNISGPFFYDGRKMSDGFYRLHLGQKALKAVALPPNLPQLERFRQSPWFVDTGPARPIQCRLFNGRLLSEGLVLIGGSMSYGVHVHLEGADMSRIAVAVEPHARNITGMLNLQAFLQGDGRKMETLGGQGRIELRNANIYEAPGMLRLLRELSVRETDPNAGAFKQADINFYLQGNRVLFNPISFEGDAFSLTGNGEMRLDTRNVNLIMKTRLGNRRTQIPIVSDILGGAGDQIVQLNIEGPISDPTVRRVALPEIQRAIRQIQGEETTDYGSYASPQPEMPSESSTSPSSSQRRPAHRLLPWK